MKLFKNWKKLIRMIAIILLIITVFNFLCSTGLPVYAAGEVTYSTGNDVLGGIADGLIGFITLPGRMFFVLVGGAIDVLTGLFVGDGEDVDVETILFNNLDLTSVDFFKTGGTNEVVKALRENVAIWYTAMRNLALAFLVIICLYVGIRMALSTAADEKAQYKRMLMDWVTSLALVFVIHYIMVAIIQFNNILVKAIEGAQINGESVAGMSDEFRKDAFIISYIKGTSSAITYLMLQLMTITILLMYVKRMITVAFLMMLSPLVAITYSIDKMGDGKAQALNTWLKEFAYTILIQPFHCLAFAALGGIAKDMVESGGGHDFMAGIFTILLITFILQSEKIVKKIFHFESSSLQDVLASAAIASSLMDKSRGFAKKTAGAANAAKELKGNMPMIKERLKNKDSNNNNNEQKQLPKEKPKKKKEKPIDYSQLTETEKKAKIKELQNKKLRLQTGATKKELALRAFLGANKIGFSTAMGIGIGGATGSDQAMFTKGFQDFTNSTADAMKKGKEFSKGRLKHEVAKSYNTAREGVMAEIKQQYIASGKGKGKNEQEQQKDLEKIFDARMKDLLNGKTDIDSLGDEEKELAKLLSEMKGTLINEGHKSNDAIDECLSLLKEIEAGEVSEVWSGEGVGAVPTYFLGDLSHKRNIEREIEQLKVEYNQFTDSTDKFPEVVPDEHEKLNPGDK
jgi:hypothetical protein